MSIAGCLKAVRDKMEMIDANAREDRFSEDDYAAIDQAIEITENYNSVDFTDQLREDIDLLAQDWDTVVAEQGMEEAREQFDELLRMHKVFGITDLPATYPDGTLIEIE